MDGYTVHLTVLNIPSTLSEILENWVDVGSVLKSSIGSSPPHGNLSKKNSQSSAHLYSLWKFPIY